MLADRTWFTENTEVLTTAGWVKIYHLTKILTLIVVEDDVIKEGNLLEYNKASYNGEVNYIKKGDIFVTYKKLFLPDDKVWRVGADMELPTPQKRLYEGEIFNLVTTSNTLITRSFTYDHSNNNDYILSLCVAK